MKYLAQTTYTPRTGVPVQVQHLSATPTERQEARDLAGRYILSVVAGARGPAQVEAVGRTGWKVTLPDGWTEVVDLVAVSEDRTRPIITLTKS